jgi:ankyrin repeat protein
MRNVVLVTLGLGLALLPKPLAAQNTDDPQVRLWEAAIAGDTAGIRAAVNAGADVDSLDTRTARNGRRALNWAALNDHPAAITLLLDFGADIEATNITGFTALNHAAEAGAPGATEALLAAGADPHHANHAGYKPVDTARENAHFHVMEMLGAAMSTED